MQQQADHLQRRRGVANDYAEGSTVVQVAGQIDNAVFWESNMSFASCGRSASCSMQATEPGRGYREMQSLGGASSSEAFGRMDTLHRDKSSQFETIGEENEEDCAVESISWSRMHSTRQLPLQFSTEASCVHEQRPRQARNVAESLNSSFTDVPVQPLPMYTGLNPLQEFSDETALCVSVQPGLIRTPEPPASLANNYDCSQEGLLLQNSMMAQSQVDYPSQGSQVASHDRPHGVFGRAPLQPGLIRSAQESVASDGIDPSVFSSTNRRHAPESPESEGYTMFIQNIPARFSQKDLLQLWPPENSYNLLYLPYSHKMRRSMGCATINFLSFGAASCFQNHWNGKPLAPDIGAKRLRITESRTQGLSSNIEFLRTSPHILRTKNPSHLPTIVQADGSFADFIEVLHGMNSGRHFGEDSEA